MIAKAESEKDKKIWKKFLRNHWNMIVVFIIGIVLAFIGAIYVYLWFVGDAQSTGLIPAILGLWSMGHIITFLLHLIFWEFIFIGIPVIVATAAAYLLWWKKIPEMERKEYREKHLFGKRSRSTESGEGFSFLIFIVFCIKVWLDDKWGVAIGTWKFDYLIYSCLWSLAVVLIIFGIPILIGGLWWLRRQMEMDL